MSDNTNLGLLLTAITVLAGVIGYLFKLLISKSKEQVTSEAAIGEERKAWAVERQKLASDAALERQKLAAEYEIKELELKAEYEKRHREVIERYDSIARADSARMLAHEDQVRKEFADIVENVSTEIEKANAATAAVLQKFYDRFVGPRPHY